MSVVTLVACGGSDGGGPMEPPPPSGTDPVVGAFTLNTVNAGPLPFTLFSEGGFELQLTASTMAMQAGGQFVMATTTRETVAGFPSTYVDSTRGTWTQNAGAVTLTDSNGAMAAATWDGTRLAFQMTSDPGVLSLVYRKDP